MVSGWGFRAARSLVFGLTLGFFLTTGIVGSAAENGLVTDPHAVGCILPLSGRYAALGSRALDAVLLATGVFQGEKETPIRLIVEDSQSEPAVAGRPSPDSQKVSASSTAGAWSHGTAKEAHI
jgi:hypothetical protein